MENLPSYISIVFILTAIASVFIFFRAASYSKLVMFIMSAWLLLQAFISKYGFYTNTSSFPPHFMLALLPPLMLIAALFILPGGRRFIDSLDIKTLTLLHTIRIPVELVLVWLFMQKTIPGIMTFEGRNFDILSGLTAPTVYYLIFVKKWAGYKFLLIWNVCCLALLLNIVITAVLSAPFPFQQLAFEQPNIAILYFPFAWLPSCVVPIVLFSHLAATRQLLINKNVNNKMH
jgi:hypothetical protein